MSNIKTLSCTLNEICDITYKSLEFNISPALVVGFVSPHLDFKLAVDKIKAIIPKKTKLILSSTAGELITKNDNAHCDTGSNWDRIVFQSFSEEIFENIYIGSVDLGCNDIKQGRSDKSPDERIKNISSQLNKMNVPFNIDFKDTVC